MNLLRLFFLFAIVTALSTCGDDDDMTPPCAPSRWAGTYTGTAECNGINEDVSVTITTSGMAAIIISYETLSRTGTSDPIVPDECTATATSSSGPITTSLEAELDGDSITFTESVTGVGGNFVCNIVAVRQ